MGMLEDDLSQFPPGVERPQKVHLFHDNKGATFGFASKPFANTLCRSNSPSGQLRMTTQHAEVTCKTCLKDARFKAYAAKQPETQERTMQHEQELVSHFRIEIGVDYVEHKFGSPQPLARVRGLATHYINALTEKLP